VDHHPIEPSEYNDKLAVARAAYDNSHQATLDAEKLADAVREKKGLDKTAVLKITKLDIAEGLPGSTLGKGARMKIPSKKGQKITQRSSGGRAVALPRKVARTLFASEVDVHKQDVFSSEELPGAASATGDHLDPVDSSSTDSDPPTPAAAERKDGSK
jgi:hypothetical protein